MQSKDTDRIYEAILAHMDPASGDYGPYNDAAVLLKDMMITSPQRGIRRAEDLRHRIEKAMAVQADMHHYEVAEELRRLLFTAYNLTAPYVFDDYCLALEFDRPKEKQFYLPRRKVLKRFVDQLQKLEDGELDELFLSCPPRIGKTTLLMFYMTWLMGKYPEKSNLYSSYSDIITNAFYQGVQEILTDADTYKWALIFPGVRIAATNAAEETLRLNRKNMHYPTLTCRSLYGTLNGSCDCEGALVSDDLIGGIEEAMNKDRLISAWNKVDNNLLTRAKTRAKILWCGTRWSVIDPAGIRMDLLENDAHFKDRRYAICNLPALNDKGESNFNYLYGVGFDTTYYERRRASFERQNDTPSWLAQYMCQPVEREGTLFLPSDLRYYDGTLPDGIPDRVFMAVDPAFGGGDYVAGLVCVQYGTDVYVPAVVYNNGEKNITQPEVVSIAMANYVTMLRIEATKMTASYAEAISKMFKDKNYRATVSTKPAPTNIGKEQKIYEMAPVIRSQFIFLNANCRPKAYQDFMTNVFAFKVNGKNKHDDAPDSLAQAADIVSEADRHAIEVFKRLF